jgi:hypothetical protein
MWSCFGRLFGPVFGALAPKQANFPELIRPARKLPWNIMLPWNRVQTSSMSIFQTSREHVLVALTVGTFFACYVLSSDRSDRRASPSPLRAVLYKFCAAEIWKRETDHIVSVSARVHVLYIFRRGGNRKRQQCIVEPRIYRRISFPPFSVAERYIPSLPPPFALRSGLDTAHHEGCH